MSGSDEERLPGFGNDYGSHRQDNSMSELSVSDFRPVSLDLASKRSDSPNNLEDMGDGNGSSTVHMLQGENLTCNSTNATNISPRPSPMQSPTLPHRKSSSFLGKAGDAPITVQCPPVNCEEQIVICLDLSHEMEKVTFRTRSGDKFPPLPLVKRALGMFMHLKQRINSKHQFALVILHDEAQWMHDFTKDPKDIISLMDELDRTRPCRSFELDSLFDLIAQRITLPRVDNPTVIPPPYVVRVLIVYGRSHCPLTATNRESQRLLQGSPHLFVDAFYVHEPPSPDNQCEAIFDSLCDLDVDGLSYVFEVSKNPTRLYDHVAQLLAHPLQRPLQKDCSYNLELKGGDIL